mmetsp:Transcript_79853/g.191711  ORF Transcript_79853/g.191711 Transcript_79853/m.191711 type:complete len:205 (+) Transcript_79853:171-785(+)
MHPPPVPLRDSPRRWRRQCRPRPVRRGCRLPWRICPPLLSTSCLHDLQRLPKSWRCCCPHTATACCPPALPTLVCFWQIMCTTSESAGLPCATCTLRCLALVAPFTRRLAISALLQSVLMGPLQPWGHVGWHPWRGSQTPVSNQSRLRLGNASCSLPSGLRSAGSSQDRRWVWRASKRRRQLSQPPQTSQGRTARSRTMTTAPL